MKKRCTVIASIISYRDVGHTGAAAPRIPAHDRTL
jgi:hypothetical protein